MNLLMFFRQMYFRIFCRSNFGCPEDVDVSLKLAEIFYSFKPGNSISIKLYTELCKYFHLKARVP